MNNPVEPDAQPWASRLLLAALVLGTAIALVGDDPLTGAGVFWACLLIGLSVDSIRLGETPGFLGPVRRATSQVRFWLWIGYTVLFSVFLLWATTLD